MSIRQRIKDTPTFDKLRIIFCAILILAGIMFFLETFLSPTSYVIDIKGRIVPDYTTIHFVWNTDTVITYIPLFALLPMGVYLLTNRRTHFQFLPRAAIFLALGNFFYALFNIIFEEAFVSEFFELGISVALIIAAVSFTRGHYHSTFRIVVIMGLFAAIDLISLLIECFLEELFPFKLYNIILVYPADFLLILAYLFFIAFAIYPNDFPSVRLHKQLNDTEYTLVCGRDLLITRADIDKLVKGEGEGWGPSRVPGVTSEMVINLHGSSAGYILTARKWEGDDLVHITLDSVTPKATTWGKGFVLIYVAEDNTVATPRGRPVRLYTQSGTFLRLVAVDAFPVETSKYKSAIAKFFEE